MKAFKLFSLVLLLPMLGHGQAKAPHISCANEMPSTTYNLTTEKDQTINLRIKHFFGTAYAPIHSGVITSSDFSYLKSKANVIAKLGEEIQVTFDRCENFGEALWACSNSKSQDINGVQVSGTGFNTRVIETKSYDNIFKTYQLVFNFVYEGMMYEIPMNFSPEECVIK